MRIAIFCPTVLGTGGMESAIQNLIGGFQASGDSVHLFLFGGSYDEAWLSELEYTEVGSIQDARLLRFIRYGFGVLSAIRSWRPDVIVCADGTTLQMALLGRMLSNKRKILIASWLHFPLEEMRLKGDLPKADIHLAISGQIAQDLRAHLMDPRARITTIYNALKPGAASTVKRPGSPVFLYVGRLNYDDHKRVNDILSAVSRLRGEWALKVVGSTGKGNEEHGIRLHSLAVELGIENRIDWLGWQVNPWDAAGEVTALISSSAREAFGMTLVEACSHGIACISSDCSGPRDIIVPGENGWFYPVADVDELASILQGIVDGVRELPPQEGIKESVGRFSADAVAGRARDAFMEANPSLQ